MTTSVLGQALIGWLAADLLSGFFHWWEDRVGTLSMPIVGDLIIAPNRDHHARPTAFVDQGTFASRNRFMIVVSLLAGGTLIWLFGFTPLIAAMMIGGAFVNEVHAWAHRPGTAPRWAKVIQETGFIQSPRHHAAHHRPPLDRNYCILTNWLNPPLDALDVWNRTERMMERLGFEPSRGTR